MPGVGPDLRVVPFETTCFGAVQKSAMALRTASFCPGVSGLDGIGILLLGYFARARGFGTSGRFFERGQLGFQLLDAHLPTPRSPCTPVRAGAPRAVRRRGSYDVDEA